jgi:hypothetical protein
LDFHTYRKEIRTAFEEHIIEALSYAVSSDKICRVHFTISSKHRKYFLAELKKIQKKLEKKNWLKLHVSFSVQDPRTNTLALDKEQKLFLNDKGFALLRPAGHGALIKNLNKLKEDIVVVRNIDNIAHDWAKTPAIEYEKIMICYLREIQEEIFKYIRQIKNNQADIAAVRQFLSKKLFLESYLTKDFTLKNALKLLDRPLRVCGMVKNEGEPGGGPFWVKDINGRASLQIVEKDQISTKQKVTIMKKSTHFNPVNIVCGITDYNGKKFNLLNYIDETAVIITEKSKYGKPLVALERPGLWNGAMADWNTIFVEIPLETFTPVKTVNDLLRVEHQPKNN